MCTFITKKSYFGNRCCKLINNHTRILGNVPYSLVTQTGKDHITVGCIIIVVTLTCQTRYSVNGIENVMVLLQNKNKLDCFSFENATAMKFLCHQSVIH